MKSGLSMTSRAEVTTRYARSFRAADKRTKGRILDEVVSVTGWSRDNARRRLTSAAQSPPGAGRSVTTRPRKQRATKFSYDALKVLQRVWAASGGQCGRYLAASMRMQLDGLERHGELVDGVGRYSMAVREELLAMSAASIDRYLRPDPQGRVRPDPEPDLRAHRVGFHPHDAQQRACPRPGRFAGGRAGNPFHHHGFGFRQRHRVPQQGRHHLGR